MYRLPSFIRKLHEIVSNPKWDEIIAWTPDGEGIMIKSIERLCLEVLPKEFRHGNYNSFLRQVLPNSIGFL